MKTKIVIITSKYLHPFAEKAFEEFKEDCDVIIADYTNFDHIADIYRKYENIADGFMISGTTAMSAIEHHVGEFKKPVISFHADMISFYHALIKLFLERRDLDPKRCIFDFMLPIIKDPENPTEATVDYLIHELDLNNLALTMDKWADKSTTGDFSIIEMNIALKTIELWEAGKIDLVFCTYSSTIPLLEEKGVPNYFLYPVKDQLESQIKELLAQIKLEKYRENLPAAIAIADRNESSHEESEAKIREAIKKIKKEFLIDAILQAESGIYYIYTTHRVVAMITKNFEIGYFVSMLKDDFGISAAIGYGIGKNITEAKKHAENALRESWNSDGSFVMNETSQLIGPLGASQLPGFQQELPDNIFKIAENCKLSTVTIQKLMSIVKMNGSYELTTNELADHMGVTVRNANRILRNLESGGAATIAHTRSTTSKGRPVKVYRLNL